MPVVKHVIVAGMTDDSHHFYTEEQLLEIGVWKRTPPPCFNCGDVENVALFRAVDDRVPLHRGWRWVGYGMMSVEYPTEGVLYVCGICYHLLRIALGPRCLICGEGVGLWCRDCADEYYASLFGDYPPPTDCGCAWHNIYAERQPCWKPERNPIRGTAQPREAIGDGRLFD